MGRRRRFPPMLHQVTFTAIADKGRCVGRDPEGQVVFAEAAAPGDVADVRIFKKRKGVLWGKAVHFHQQSTERVTPFCEHFGVCGGCKWQHISYEAQLKHKEGVVRDAVDRLAKVDIEDFQSILGADPTTYYRNKLEFGCANRRWLTEEEVADESISQMQDVIGFHRAGAYDKIIQIDHCYLQADPSNTLRNGIGELARQMEVPFFDMRERHGLLRQMMVRTSSLGETMLLIAFYEESDLIEPLLQAIIDQYSEVTSLYYCINGKVNEFLLDLPFVHFHGKTTVEETLGHVRYLIGPKSFFQTNPNQAVTLYDTAMEFADLQGDENVYDLYTGIGSIALYAAKHCEQVVGIEEIAAAIDDAKVNAKLNDIDNVRFYAGDVKDILTPEFAAEHGKPDVLITDPPRAGMHPKVVQMLIELGAPKLVYVSCNPATQARDFALLDEHYRVAKLRPVDMFPHTSHIETVALLLKR